MTEIRNRHRKFIGAIWLVVAAGVVGAIVCYILFGHGIVEKVVRGELFAFLQPNFAHRPDVSLEQWQSKFDKLAAVLLVMSVTVICFAFAMRGRWGDIIASARHNMLDREQRSQSLRAPSRLFRLSRIELIVTLAFTIILGIAYYLLGHEWAAMKGFFDYQSTIFGADHIEAIKFWHTGEVGQFHTGSHPLLPLFVVPLLAFAFWLTSNPFGNVLCLVAISGAISAGVMILSARILGTGMYTAMMGGLLFAASMSQLVFSAIPETYAMAGLSAVLSYALLIVSLNKRQLLFPLWIALGIMSFGMLITNVLQTVICFVIVVREISAKEQRRTQVLTFLLVLGSAGVGLAVLQRMMFPQAELFFIPTAMLTPTEYMGTTAVSFGRTLVELVSNFGFLSVIGCMPSVLTDPAGVISLSYFAGWKASALAIVTAIGFGGLLLFAIRSWLQTPAGRPLFTAILCGLGVNVAIHFFYGVTELFLYSCNYTFLVVALVALAPAAKTFWFRFGLTLVVVLLVINNYLALRQLFSMIQ